MLTYLTNLLRRLGADGAYIQLRDDLSDGYTWATLTEQGQRRAIATLIGFASREG